MSTIILNNGQKVDLKKYQTMLGYPEHKVSKFFNINEMHPTGHFVIAELLLILLDKFRLRINEPVILNSAFRPKAHQTEMRKTNKHAAIFSPHPEGMAVDIETKNEEETHEKAAILEQIAKELGINIRIGFKKYLKSGMTFIHVDVCPEFFAPNKPFHKQKHPWQWEVNARW